MGIGYFLISQVIKLFHSKITIFNRLHKESCKIVCKNGGHILEIGFGVGIDSDFIQNHNIKSHTIVEINDYFFGKLVEWKKDKPNVKIIKGDGLTHIPPSTKYDGIFLDFCKEDNKFVEKLVKVVKEHSNRGTICVNTQRFDETLFIKEGFSYEQIIPDLNLKWYNFISHLFRYIPCTISYGSSKVIKKLTYTG